MRDLKLNNEALTNGFDWCWDNVKDMFPAVWSAIVALLFGIVGLLGCIVIPVLMGAHWVIIQPVVKAQRKKWAMAEVTGPDGNSVRIPLVGDYESIAQVEADIVSYLFTKREQGEDISGYKIRFISNGDALPNEDFIEAGEQFFSTEDATDLTVREGATEELLSAVPELSTDQRLVRVEKKLDEVIKICAGHSVSMAGLNEDQADHFIQMSRIMNAFNGAAETVIPTWSDAYKAAWDAQESDSIEEKTEEEKVIALLAEVHPDAEGCKNFEDAAVKVTKRIFNKWFLAFLDERGIPHVDDQGKVRRSFPAMVAAFRKSLEQ